MNAASLGDVRSHASAVVVEMVSVAAKGERLPEDWIATLALANWSLDRFETAVRVAEQRVQARRVLAGIADREAVLAEAEEAWAKDNEKVQEKVRKIQEEAARKVEALSEPLDARKRELERTRAEIRSDWSDSRNVLKSTACREHIARTDEEIGRLKYRRATLDQDLGHCPQHMKAAKWRDELVTIDERLQELERGRFET